MDLEGCVWRKQSSVTSCLSERFKVSFLASAVCMPAFVRDFFCYKAYIQSTYLARQAFWFFLVCRKNMLSSWFSISVLLVACFLHIGIARVFWTLSLIEGCALLSREMSLWIPFVDCWDEHTRKQHSLGAAKFSIILSFNFLRRKIGC